MTREEKKLLGHGYWMLSMAALHLAQVLLQIANGGFQYGNYAGMDLNLAKVLVDLILSVNMIEIVFSLFLGTQAIQVAKGDGKADRTYAIFCYVLNFLEILIFLDLSSNCVITGDFSTVKLVTLCAIALLAWVENRAARIFRRMTKNNK